MPLQGHWERVNTPLRATTVRERRILVIVGALLGAAALGAIIVAIATSRSGSSGSAATGCVRVEFPSTMGASASEICGSTAAEFCRSSAAESASLRESAQAQCREQGYPTRSD
jgi:hypothetical protein